MNQRIALRSHFITKGWVHEPTDRSSIALYPKGIPQQSPGLRGTSYPGYPRARGLNSEGVAPLETYTAMPQSGSVVYIHLVFSTKERRPFLRDEAIRKSLHAYLGSVSKQLECPPLKVCPRVSSAA